MARWVVCGVALAAVAVSGAAFAQAHNQVSLSGTIAGGVQNNDAGTKYGFQTTAITIRASEDLGGGLTASGAVTIGGMTKRDAPAKTEDSSLSLAGGFGTVTLANTRSTNAAVGGNVASISLPSDQYIVEGVFTGEARTTVTNIAYVSPELAPGLRVTFTRSMSEADNDKATNVYGVSYSAGPLAVVAVVKNANTAQLDSNTTNNVIEGWASYDMGVAKVGVGYAGKTTATDKTAMTFGVSAPVTSNITLGLNYGKRDKAKYQHIGATYALSKRTSVSLASGSFTNTENVKQTQSRLRVAHSF